MFFSGRKLTPIGTRTRIERFRWLLFLAAGVVLFPRRRQALLLASVVSALFLNAVPAQAATLTVTSGSDSGVGTLRQAILDASSGDTINFVSGLTTIDLINGQLLIDKNLTINGPGADKLTVQRSNSASQFFRIFEVNTAVAVTFSRLTIANGVAQNDDGGGIFNVAGAVNVTNCTLSGNSADGGFGGAIFSSTGAVNITNCTLSGNSANSGFGGGIFSSTGTVNITNSTLTGNSANNGIGGGIYNGSSTLNVTNSTLSGNSAGQGGGIKNNSGATANIRSSIIALNTATSSGPDVFGAFTSQGYNLIGNNSGSMITPAAGDQIGTPGSPIDPLLGQLADNGGPTKTQALLSGSPAINAGDPNSPPRDQRGYVRQNAADVGAFEFGATIPVTLANISTRAFVQTGDNVMIGGVIITGSGQKKVILRAIGPSLVNFGITDPLQDPTLELHDHTGAVIAFNDNWMDAPNKQAIIDSGLAPSNNLESAILMSLDPGNYTAIVRGVNSGIGIALVEGYDLDRTAVSKLGNISTRSLVQTGDNVMIGGLIITGPDSDKVVVRAIGPSLAQYGITNPLLDPTLELHDGNGMIIGFNDNWKDSQQADIEATGLAPSDDAESAIVQTLAPGNYTAIVRGKNDTIGIALVEVYGLN